MLKELLLNLLNRLSTLNDASAEVLLNLKGNVLAPLKLKSAFLVPTSVFWNYKLNVCPPPWYGCPFMRLRIDWENQRKRIHHPGGHGVHQRCQRRPGISKRCGLSPLPTPVVLLSWPERCDPSQESLWPAEWCKLLLWSLGWGVVTIPQEDSLPPLCPVTPSNVQECFPCLSTPLGYFTKFVNHKPYFWAYSESFHLYC